MLFVIALHSPLSSFIPFLLSPDIPQLESALTKIGIVVGMVNENKRTAENSEKIFSIQQQLEAGESLQLLSPTRRFVMEGKIAELTEDRYQITNKSYYFLFNDILSFPSFPFPSLSLPSPPFPSLPFPSLPLPSPPLPLPSLPFLPSLSFLHHQYYV